MVLSPQSYHLYMLKEDGFYFTNTLLTLQQNTNKTLLVKKWWLKYHFVPIIFKVYWYNTDALVVTSFITYISSWDTNPFGFCQIKLVELPTVLTPRIREQLKVALFCNISAMTAISVLSILREKKDFFSQCHFKITQSNLNVCQPQFLETYICYLSCMSLYNSRKASLWQS